MDTRGFITEASAGIAGAAWSGGDLASKTAGPQRSNASPAPGKGAFMGRTEAVAATLPKPTLRLLSALDAAGAYAVADPTQDGMALVRAARDGVSVGAGLYPCGPPRISPGVISPIARRRPPGARRSASRKPDGRICGDGMQPQAASRPIWPSSATRSR